MFNPWVGKIPLEEEMATHSSIPAGKSHGQRSWNGCSPRSHKESDTTEQLNNKNDKQEIIIIRIRSRWSLSIICYLTEAQEVRSGITQSPLRCRFTEDSSLIHKGWVLTHGVLVPDFLPGHGDLTKGRIVA